MSAAYQLHPEVRELLQEMGRDPASRLFRIPRCKALAVSPMADVPSASAGTAGWTPAERHLLVAHRDEVAALFIDAFRAKIVADERASSLFRVPTLEGNRWPGELARLVAAATGPDRNAGDLRALQVEDAAGLPSYETLAVCAERCAPSCLTGLYRGMALILAERHGEAVDLLREFDVPGASPMTRRFTWSLRATALAEADRPRAAMVAISRAWQLDQTRMDLLASALVFTILMHEEWAARLASGMLDGMGSGATLSPYLDMLSQQRRSGALTLSPDTLHFMTKLRDDAGPVAIGVIHALLHP
jgi:hypothetical protein